MGIVYLPLTGTPVYDSAASAAAYGAQQFAELSALEQYSVPRYADAATGNTKDTAPVPGKTRWVNTAGPYGEHLQYYADATNGWLPLIPGLSWYNERTTSDDTSAGTFGNAAQVTLNAAPPGRYMVWAKLACQPVATGIVYPRIRFGGTNIGTDVPNSVGSGSFFSDSVFAPTTLASPGSSVVAALQAQSAAGILHLQPGSRIGVVWLGL